MDVLKTLGLFLHGIRPTTTDWLGMVVSFAGMAIIIFGPRPAS